MRYFFGWKGSVVSISVLAKFVPREDGKHVVHVFPEEGSDFAFLATLKEIDGYVVATSHLGVTTFRPQ